MSFLKKMFSQGNQEAKKSYNTAFDNIILNLKNNNLTLNLSKDLNVLVENNNAKKEDYILILNKLNEILKQEEEKKKYINNILKIKNYALNLNDEFNNEIKSFENFSLDFENLLKENEMLVTLKEITDNIFSNEKLKNINDEYTVLYETFNKVKKESEDLILEEESFSKEVEKFSITINEFKEKYRLSIDWEGKKPLMISYRKKLSTKREALVEKEEKLNKKVEVLYAVYPLLKEKLLKEKDYIINFIKTEEEFLEDTVVDTLKLSEIYSEFNNEINKIIW